MKPTTLAYETAVARGCSHCIPEGSAKKFTPPRKKLRPTHTQQAIQQRVVVCISVSFLLFSSPKLSPAAGQHIRVNGWPLLVVVDGVTREFFRSRNSLLVLDASDLTVSMTGPSKTRIRWKGSIKGLRTPAKGLFTFCHHIADA